MFWDKAAGFYDVVMKLRNGRGNDAFCTAVAERINAEDDVLECACGTGLLTVRLAEKCRSLIATDYSEGMLTQARKKCAAFPNVRIEACDITKLPYADESFDKAAAANVIHLLDDPQQAMKELMRVCKPGGMVILPTYVNRQRTGESGLFIRILSRLGAGFREQFTFESYQAFIRQCGAEDAEFTLAEGAMPCAVAFVRKPKESIS